jgi:hypothetical protein
MPTYFQLGHNSEVLVTEPGLAAFSGVILSPVNRDEASLARYISVFRKNASLDIILDPQLYFPKSQRGKLAGQRYFRSDFETADMSSVRWWSDVVSDLINLGEDLSVDAICSPAIMPSKWTDDYFRTAAETFYTLRDFLSDRNSRAILTLCINLKQLSSPADALRIASIITTSTPSEVYLVIEAETEPRRELSEPTCLLSLMVLIDALEKAGSKVTVSHTSSEIVLAKAAGATSCATGQFFNLRRFSKNRFEEESDAGGGQLAYWFEQSLFAYLRRADIARFEQAGFGDLLVQNEGLSTANPFGLQILEQFTNEPTKPWVGLGWRQFLWWFSNIEMELSGNQAIEKVAEWLRGAEARWQILQDKDVLFDEPRNDGKWIRSWRQALADFKRYLAGA